MDYKLIDMKRSGLAERAIKAFESAFEVSITVHDVRGRLRNAKGDPLLPGRHLHMHECCMRGRYVEPGWGAKCVRDCARESDKLAALELKPFRKSCWKGLVEIVVPVAEGGEHALTLYAGPFRADEEPESAPKRKWLARAKAELEEAEPKRLSSLIEPLLALGAGLLALAEGRAEEEASDGGRPREIAKIVSANAHRAEFRLEELAKALHLSPSRASHAVKEACNRTFKELLNKERMLRARALLLNSEMKLEEIAEAVGLSNAFYFNRAFKGFFGEAPGRFRKRLRAEKEKPPASS